MDRENYLLAEKLSKLENSNDEALKLSEQISFLNKINKSFDS